MSEQHYDILIAGGGLIGTTLALALHDSPWRIALVEAHIPPQHPQATQDMRAIALSYASQQIFQQLAVWSPLIPFATPIEKIHVSEKGHFGNTLLNAKEIALPALGYVVPILYLYQSLQKQLSQTNLTLYRPAQMTEIKQENNRWKIRVNEEWISATLVIAADGDNSFIRQTLNIATDITDYQQTAIVSRVHVSHGHQHIAYERFTKDGILALLPLVDNHMAVIWTLPPHTATTLLTQSDEEFIAFTQQAIGQRIGKITQLGKRQSYPLREVYAQQQTLPGLVLLGNAAHALHTVAAQGFNLGLRDTMTLAKLLRETLHLPNEHLLQQYLQQRQTDQQQTIKFTQRLVELFAPQGFPLPTLRGLGLAGFDLFPWLKRKFSRQRIGEI